MNPAVPNAYAGIPDDGGGLLDLPELKYLKLIVMQEEENASISSSLMTYYNEIARCHVP